MRIGVFSNTYKPTVSGVVTSICLFRQGLQQRGHEVLIFAPASRGYEDYEEGIFRYPAIDLPETLNASLAVPLSLRISRILPSLGLDIIHSHHPVVMGRKALRVSRRLEVPLVFTCHSRYEDFSDYVPLGELSDPLVKKAIRHLVTDYVNDCDMAICPSRHVMQLLRGYGISRPMEVIPTPVELDVFGKGHGDGVRQKHGLVPTNPVLVYVGRLALEKELQFLLRAFQLVLNGKPDCRLMLVGSGPEERLLRLLSVELGISEQVAFVGYVEHAQVPDYLAASDLFVFCSRSEVQPLCVLEALAAGLPIVAVRSPATEELLMPGMDAVLTERNERAFAFRVLSLLRDEDVRHELGHKARRTARRYSLGETAERLEQAYERLRSRTTLC